MKCFTTFFLIVIITSICYLLNLYEYFTYGPLEIINIGEGKTLKVGLLSDSQLMYNQDDKNLVYSQHLERSFNVMKEHGVDVLIFAGDISERGTKFAFQTFRSIFDKVFSDNPPILNIIMGNHDYWTDYLSTPFYQQYLFSAVIKEKPRTHKVINGFHFINWSSETLSYKPGHHVQWVKEQIEMAIDEDPSKPVFVTTHYNPTETIYGSNEWGSDLITNVLKDYYQVVSFSGHSHFSLIDERSIWQGEFTAIQTQSTAYIELERGKKNGSVPKDEYGSKVISKRNYMGIIMDLNDTMVFIKRISLEKNKFYDEPWTIEIPIDKAQFKYQTQPRRDKAKPPIFKPDTPIEVVHYFGKIYQIKFKQAFHENFVHSYRIVLLCEDDTIDDCNSIKEYLYFSDFYLLKEDRKEYIRLKLPTRMKLGIPYKVSIYAIESFGKESLPIWGDIILN